MAKHGSSPSPEDRASLELRANRMDLVSRWADDLAHEIKNPLHAMVINLELVKRRAGSTDPEPIVQRAEVVEAELHRVHGLVDSMLRLVRPWPPGSSVDPDRVFEDLLPVLGARTRIRRLDFEHHPGGAPVDLSPEGMAVVLLNLMDNAIDAAPAGGRIVTRCQTGDRVRITVTDSGPGVPPEIADRVLEPGVSGREQRAGLGLSVSARLVREAGGELTVEGGTGGSGTVVTVVLPPSASA